MIVLGGSEIGFTSAFVKSINCPHAATIAFLDRWYRNDWPLIKA